MLTSINCLFCSAASVLCNIPSNDLHQFTWRVIFNVLYRFPWSRYNKCLYCYLIRRKSNRGSFKPFFLEPMRNLWGQVLQDFILGRCSTNTSRWWGNNQVEKLYQNHFTTEPHNFTFKSEEAAAKAWEPVAAAERRHSKKESTQAFLKCLWNLLKFPYWIGEVLVSSPSAL